jgi:hypothetical protein
MKPSGVILALRGGCEDDVVPKRRRTEYSQGPVMTAPKNSFCFAPMYNSPQHVVDGKVVIPHDATGAFLPYMEAFRRLYSAGDGTVITLPFDNRAKPATEFEKISHGMNTAPSQLDAVVYFGHGMPYGMVSPDIYEKDIPKFADLIKRNSAQGVKVVLYACNCGKVNQPGGSFAAKLAAALSDLKAEVFGHDNVGHTTTNANIYRYSGGGPAVPLAPPGKFSAFNRILKAESLDQKPRGNTAFWARIPFMTSDEIAAEVGG